MTHMKYMKLHAVSLFMSDSFLECNTDFVFAYTGETAQQFSCVAKSTVLPTDSDQIHHDCSVIESPITGVPKCLDCRSSNA
jgi:hypothetical protein